MNEIPPEDSIEELLTRVVDLPDAEQEVALSNLCADHPVFAAALRERHEWFRRLQSTGPATDAAIAGTMFGEFELLRELGRGAMGIVYLARQRRAGIDRTVALKLIRDRGLVSPKAHERFRREAAASFRMDDPGLCPVFDAGEVDGTPWLAMRYVPGNTLRDHIDKARQTGALTLPGTPATSNASSSGSEITTQHGGFGTVLALAESLARSLHVAHEAGFVHRDVKPSNIVVTPDGQPVLLDFGLVREQSEAHSLTATGEALGTPTYMAPEQINGSVAVDRTADIYALAATVFEAVALEPPFAGRTKQDLFRAILHEAPNKLRRLVPAAPSDLAIVLETALSRDCSHRYQTALDFALELGRVRRNEPVLARPASPLRRLIMWSSRNRLAAGLMTGLLAALIAVALVAVEARQQQARATSTLQSARRAVGELIRVQQEELDGVPWLEGTRREMQQRALGFLREFVVMHRDNADLALDQAEAMILAANLELSLGRPEVAQQLESEAEAALAAIAEPAPAIRGTCEMLAGKLQSREGNYHDAASSYLAAADLLRANPRNADDTVMAAHALRQAAAMLEHCNDRVAAFAAIDASVAMQSNFAGLSSPRVTLAIAAALRQRARLHLEANKTKSADADCEKADQLLRSLVDRVPHNRHATKALADNLMAHTNIHRVLGRADEQRSALAEAQRRYQSLATSFPRTPSYRFDLALAAQNRATLLNIDGKRAASLRELDRAKDLFTQLVSEHPENVGFRLSLANTLVSLGQYHHDDAPAAAAYFQASLDHALALVDDHPTEAEYRFLASRSAMSLAGTHFLTSDDRAQDCYRLAGQQANALIALRPNDQRPAILRASILHNEGLFLAETGKLVRAAEKLQQAAEQAYACATAAPNDLRRCWEMLRFQVLACQIVECTAPGNAPSAWSSLASKWQAQPAKSRDRLTRFGAAEPELCMLARGTDADSARTGDPTAATKLEQVHARIQVLIDATPESIGIRAESILCLADLVANAIARADSLGKSKWQAQLASCLSSCPAGQDLSRMDRLRLRVIRHELEVSTEGNPSARARLTQLLK